MRSAKIIEGKPFDWNRGEEAMKNVVNSDGSINWGAAAVADPGVTHCPVCSTKFWAEGTRLECTVCKTHFPTRPLRGGV